MPVFEIYATGTYTYTRKITAETQEEAETEFNSNPPEICYQCGSEGIELDEPSAELTVEEIFDDEDED